jgi:hypothetical protein
MWHLAASMGNSLPKPQAPVAACHQPELISALNQRQSEISYGLFRNDTADRQQAIRTSRLAEEIRA